MASEEQKQFDLAEVRTERLLLGDPAFPPVEMWPPASLKLIRGRLYWSFAAEAGTGRPLDHLLRADAPLPGGKFRRIREDLEVSAISLKGPVVTDPRAMLDAFIRIRDGKDVLRFAHRYGILNLCPHDYPITRAHSVKCEPRGSPGPYWGPVGSWLCFVREAKSILNTTAAIHQGKRPSQADWANVTMVRFSPHPSDLPPKAQKECVGYAVDHWLQRGNIRPTFWWSQSASAPALGLDGDTFGTLAIQIAFAVGRSQGIAVCSSCGQLYLRRTRKPQAGRRNYCPQCGERAAARDRQRGKHCPANRGAQQCIP